MSDHAADKIIGRWLAAVDPVVDCPMCGDDADHASAPGPNEPIDEYDCPHCGHQFRQPSTSATIDDMLEWLRESPWHVSRLTPGSPKDTPSHRKCRPAVVMLDRAGREHWFHAPTLHEALRAAVIGVAHAVA